MSMPTRPIMTPEQAAVLQEVARARGMHRPFPTDPVRALCILTEEVGEAAQAVLAYTREGGVSDHNLHHLYDEVVQVAAVAHQWLENINRLRK